MSLKYEILKKAVRASGIKNHFRGSPDVMIARAKKMNEKTSIPLLSDPELSISLIQIDGFPVMTIRQKKKADKANLFIIGGGMIKSPRPDSVKKAVNIAKETGLDLYVPYYPLCTDYPLSKAYEMILETYQKMLKEYEAANISILGTSSGGNLALGLAAHINACHPDLPKPGLILAISPGTCAYDEAEWKRMTELDEKDVIIPAEYMKTAEVIMRHGDADVPEYMIYLQKGDFTGCGKVIFMYGSDETLYAVAPSFEQAMKKYHVPYEMIVGDGMFHCYPVFPICREAREGWKQMISILKGEQVTGDSR